MEVAGLDLSDLPMISAFARLRCVRHAAKVRPGPCLAGARRCVLRGWLCPPHKQDTNMRGRNPADPLAAISK